MTMLTTHQYLKTLCEGVKAARVQGGFLLSTGELSNYWIPIDRLRTYQNIAAIVEILQVCLPNLQRATGAETIFTPKITTSTADTFPLDIIVSIAISQLQKNTITSPQKPLNFCSVNFDQYREVVSVPEGSPSGTWLGVFTMSAHVKMITTILGQLQRRERKVKYALVLIEREQVTRQRLQQQEISLIPLVICDEDTGEPTAILDIHRLPYNNYHKYFIDHS